MFTEILNPYINTHNKVKDRYGTWKDLVYSHEKDFYKKRLVVSLKNPGDEFSVFNVKDKMVIVDQFNLLNRVQEDENTSMILLDTPNADENSYNIWDNQHFVLYSETGDTFLRVPRISNYTVNSYSEYLEPYGEIESGTEGEKIYRLRLKKPIILPEGGRMYLKNPLDRVGFGEIEFIIKYRVVEEGL